jgi:hypothetical protein
VQDSRGRIGSTLLVGIPCMKSDLRVYRETVLRLERKDRLFSVSWRMFVCNWIKIIRQTQHCLQCLKKL